jgi:hypothetical protein
VPTVAAAADTTIYLHYGDAASAFVPANPWTDYLAVYHFEDPLGNSNVADSGPGGIDGVASDLDGSDSVAGMVGRAFRFENGGDAVRVNSSTLGNGGPVTVVAWARLDGGDTGFPRIVHQGGFENRRMELYVEDGFGTSFGELTWRTNEDTDFGNTWLQATPPGFAFGDWHHYVGVADNVGTTMRLYYDGAQVASGSWDPPIDADDDTFIGNWDDGGGGTRNWVGAIDEVHFYDGVLGAAWVGAAFDNGTSPTTFSTMGPEQAL